MYSEVELGNDTASLTYPPPKEKHLPGPQNCLRTRRLGSLCATCHQVPRIAHLPLNMAAVVFCERCCVNCSGGGR